MAKKARTNVFGRLFWEEAKPQGRIIIKDRYGNIIDFSGCIPNRSFNGAKVSVRYEETKTIITIQNK